MSKSPADSLEELLKLAGCEGNETAAGELSKFLEIAKFSLSPGKKLGPVRKDDWDRKLKKISKHAGKLAPLLKDVPDYYPYNAALGVDAEFVARLEDLAKTAKAQKPQKNQTELDQTCTVALIYLGKLSQIRIRKGATGDSFDFVHKFAECVFARELASDGPGGTKGAYLRAVKDLENSGQNSAPASP